jgi:mRNA interferase YafQ
MNGLKEAMLLLVANNGPLPPEWLDHPLTSDGQKYSDLFGRIAEVFPHSQEMLKLFPYERDVFAHNRMPSCLAIKAMGLRSP